MLSETNWNYRAAVSGLEHTHKELVATRVMILVVFLLWLLPTMLGIFLVTHGIVWLIPVVPAPAILAVVVMRDHGRATAINYVREIFINRKFWLLKSYVPIYFDEYEYDHEEVINEVRSRVGEQTSVRHPSKPLLLVKDQDTAMLVKLSMPDAPNRH